MKENFGKELLSKFKCYSELNINDITIDQIVEFTEYSYIGEFDEFSYNDDLEIFSSGRKYWLVDDSGTPIKFTKNSDLAVGTLMLEKEWYRNDNENKNSHWWCIHRVVNKIMNCH